MKIVSKGNSKIRYSGNVQIIDGKKLVDEYSLTGGVVGQKNYFVDRQKIKTDKIKNAGEYTLRAVFLTTMRTETARILRKKQY